MHNGVFRGGHWTMPPPLPEHKKFFEEKWLIDAVSWA